MRKPAIHPFRTGGFPALTEACVGRLRRLIIHDAYHDNRWKYVRIVSLQKCAHVGGLGRSVPGRCVGVVWEGG